jgi:tRNA(Arg) A34 adenosine deaminase TadA
VGNVLQIGKIKKWIGGRKGRLTLLAHLLGKEKSKLYSMIYENRLSVELIQEIETKQKEAETLEKECLKNFPYLKRFINRGEGRVTQLAKRLGVSANTIRNLGNARGDSRFVLIKYGVSQVMVAMRECDKQRTRACYSYEKIDMKKYFSTQIKKSVHTLEQVMQIADSVKEHADFGNHDSAVVCRIMGENKYKIISIGFDTKFSDMCRSHVCDKSNPHMHAAMFAALNVQKQHINEVGGLMVYSHSAPCPNCANRLHSIGIAKMYCLFEPELMDGLHFLAQNNIPVIKYNLVTKKHKQINFLKNAA